MLVSKEPALSLSLLLVTPELVGLALTYGEIAAGAFLTDHLSCELRSALA